MSTETKDKDRTGKVLQKLSREEIEAKGKELAGQVQDREVIAEKKRSHNREWNEQLRQLDVVINTLSEEVDSGQAYVDANMLLPGLEAPKAASKANGAAKKAPAKKAFPPKKPAGKTKSAGARA